MYDADTLVKMMRGLKREAAALALRELAREAREGYTGLAAYSCPDSETEIAEMVARLADDTAKRLEQGEPNPCPYTHSHTREWCGYEKCRES